MILHNRALDARFSRHDMSVRHPAQAGPQCTQCEAMILHNRVLDAALAAMTHVRSVTPGRRRGVRQRTQCEVMILHNHAMFSDATRLSVPPQAGSSNAQW